MPSLARHARAIEDTAATEGGLRPAVAGDRLGVVSRFLGWAYTLPWHGWWLFAVIGLGMLAWGQAILWATGEVPPGTIDPTLLALAVYGPYALAALAVGRTVAQRALTAFWPATGWPEGDRPTWTARFAGAPAAWEAVALLAGVIGGLAALAASPAIASSAEGSRLVIAGAYAPTYVLGYGLGAVGVVITMRWLSLVSRIHREAATIDPFDPGPIFAFSRLTVTSGLSYIVAIYYSFTVNAAAQAGNIPSLAFLASMGLFGAALFVVPLWGIHGRLVDEKEALTRDVERRLSVVASELYARIDAGDFASTAALNESLTGLTALRERVVRLPTWPWPPQLFRGFVSALLLPIVIFVLTRVISVILES